MYVCMYVYVSCTPSLSASAASVAAGAFEESFNVEYKNIHMYTYIHTSRIVNLVFEVRVYNYIYT